MTTFKVTVFALLEGAPRKARAQRIFDAILVSLILGNVLAVILVTVESISARYAALFFYFELLSVSAFTLELLLRFWVSDLPSALWWVVVTLSTVGYGDAIPLTVLGRVLGAVIMVLGVGMVALPAGMLASRFAQVMHRQQDLFRHFVEQSIEAEGGVSEELVEQYRQELFISRGEAKAIIANSIEESQRQLKYCPNCGSKLPGRRTD